MMVVVIMTKNHFSINAQRRGVVAWSVFDLRRRYDAMVGKGKSVCDDKGKHGKGEGKGKEERREGEPTTHLSL